MNKKSAKHTPGPCDECSYDPGSHPPGAVFRESACGCSIGGFGLLPSPWHIHQCDLHTSAPRLLAERDALVGALEDVLTELHEAEEDRNPESGEVYPHVERARAAIRRVKERA